MCKPLWYVLLMMLGSAPPASAVDEPLDKDTASTFTVYFENDLFGDTDQNYTNGIQFSWISPDLTQYRDNTPRWMVPLVRRLPFINEPGLQRNVGFSIGQQIFTPQDIQRRDLIDDDRPYAGWLYVATAFHNKNYRRLDTLELQLGMIGPASLAEEAQNLVHEVRDIPTAKGWDHQLENEPGFLAIYERKERVISYGESGGWGFDAITHYGGAVGNVYIYANGGIEARFGWNVPADFGTASIRPAGDTNAPSDSSDPRFSTYRRVGLHSFVGVTGRVVARDIFLDGNTFADSHNVDKKFFVGDLAIGASAIAGSFKLSYAQVFRSKEFDGQDRGHNFGSISLSYSF